MNNRIKELSADELIFFKKKAEKQKKETNQLLLVLVGIIVLFFVATFFMSARENAMKALLVISILYGIAFILINQKNVKIKKDLKNRKKEIITGIIEDKKETRTRNGNAYFFYISKAKINVPITEYIQFKEGNHVEIHRAIYSKIVLKINLIH